MEWDKEKVKRIRKLQDNNKLKFRYGIPWQGSKPIDYDVFSIPIDDLSYNFRNTRIRAELEGEKGKTIEKIDPLNQRNLDFVENILLTSKWIGKQETSNLKKDLKERGQLDPAVVTPDGVLINGNRRLAIFKKILSEPLEKDEELKFDFSKMKVCILKEESTKNDLKELEMRLQMYQNFKVGYGDINISLEFKDLHEEFDWSIGKIAKLTGDRYDEKLVEKMIKVIKMIDEYLDLHDISKQYISVDKKWESFENLYRILQWTSKQEKNNPENESIIYNRKILGFKIIQYPKSTFRDIRRLNSVLRNEDSREKIEGKSNTLQGKSLSNFANSSVNFEFNVLNNCEEYLKTSKQDPILVAEIALNKLETIKRINIVKGDTKFLKILDKLQNKINSLKERI